MSTVKNKSKRYQSLLKDLDQTKAYKIDDAVKLIKDRCEYTCACTWAWTCNMPMHMYMAYMDIDLGNGTQAFDTYKPYTFSWTWICDVYM